MVLQANKID